MEGSCKDDKKKRMRKKKGKNPEKTKKNDV
jgi:hypothetical protein